MHVLDFISYKATDKHLLSKTLQCSTKCVCIQIKTLLKCYVVIDNNYINDMVESIPNMKCKEIFFHSVNGLLEYIEEKTDDIMIADIPEQSNQSIKKKR